MFWFWIIPVVPLVILGFFFLIKAEKVRQYDSRKTRRLQLWTVVIMAVSALLIVLALR
jgi:hypothetical protein